MTEQQIQLADEELMRELAVGQHDALAPLYHRYAPLIAGLARRGLDSAAGEDIVQDVFLTVWRNAAVFSPERGTFRHWVLQIARHRILNELRARRRRPQSSSGPEDYTYLHHLPDHGPEPDQQAWLASLRAGVRDAVGQLPVAQREVVGLAFFEERTHTEVANQLAVPLGTAKTRIRAGLKTLRSTLAPFLAGTDDAHPLRTGPGRRGRHCTGDPHGPSRRHPARRPSNYTSSRRRGPSSGRSIHEHPAERNGAEHRLPIVGWGRIGPHGTDAAAQAPSSAA